MITDTLNEVLEHIKHRKSVLIYGEENSGKTRLLKYLNISLGNSVYIYPCSSKKFIEVLCSKFGIKPGKSIVDSFNLRIDSILRHPDFVLIIDDFYEFDKRTRRLFWKLSKNCVLIASSYSKTRGFSVCIGIGKNHLINAYRFNPYNLMLVANILIMLRYLCYMNNEFKAGYLVSTIGYIFMMAYRIARNRKNK